MNITQITPDAFEVTMRLHPITEADHTVTNTMIDSDAIMELIQDGIDMAKAGMPAQVLIASILTSGIRLGWYVREDMGAIEDVTRLVGVSEEEIRASVQ